FDVLALGPRDFDSVATGSSRSAPYGNLSCARRTCTSRTLHMTMSRAEQLAQLRRNLDQWFGDEDLRTLCFDLGIDYDDLPGRAKADKARELLSELDRRGRIPELVRLCAAKRPNVVWPDIPPVADVGPQPMRRPARPAALAILA